VRREFPRTRMPGFRCFCAGLGPRPGLFFSPRSWGGGGTGSCLTLNFFFPGGPVRRVLKPGEGKPCTARKKLGGGAVGRAGRGRGGAGSPWARGEKKLGTPKRPRFVPDTGRGGNYPESGGRGGDCPGFPAVQKGGALRQQKLEKEGACGSNFAFSGVPPRPGPWTDFLAPYLRRKRGREGGGGFFFCQPGGKAGSGTEAGGGHGGETAVTAVRGAWQIGQPRGNRGRPGGGGVLVGGRAGGGGDGKLCVETRWGRDGPPGPGAPGRGRGGQGGGPWGGAERG